MVYNDKKATFTGIIRQEQNCEYTRKMFAHTCYWDVSGINWGVTIYNSWNIPNRQS